MPVMHEYMHERTGGQQEVRQYLKHVRAVLGPEEVGNHQEKANQDDFGP
jgi:hypothetical protein